ncbi:uncharacterized protein METZ01_LOCUS132851 [marine metagenome]|uniref:Uncharacterized protein n=1 Tax=marine metagenome TaxID=408172 RepID=A0A381YU21_9ZZZZ
MLKVSGRSLLTTDHRFQNRMPYT